MHQNEPIAQDGEENASGEPQNNPEDEVSDNPFEKEKFDPQVGVDEDADPKKFLEKLTGKLATSLRDYNEGETDAALNKFIVNSIVAASVPSMGPSDAKDVIKKVKDNMGKAEIAPTPEAQPEADVDVNIEEPQVEPEAPKLESVSKKKKAIKENESIDELVERLLCGTGDSEISKPEVKAKKNIFKAPEFK